MATRSRVSSVVQSSAPALRRACRNSAQEETRGTTKQAACGTARCIRARGRVWMVIEAGAGPCATWRMSIRASARRRAISRSRSRFSVTGAPGATATVTGPSKRDRVGMARPLSISKLSSRKSRAISVFDRVLASGRGVPNMAMGGSAAGLGQIGNRRGRAGGHEGEGQDGKTGLDHGRVSLSFGDRP